jgi:Xaa-Pro aminopeptidase
MYFTDNIKKELQLRWKKIQSAMKKEQIDACLISTNVNLLYALGQVIIGYVYLQQEGDALIFVKRPEGISNNETSFTIRKPEQIVDILRQKDIKLPETLLLESGEISHEEYLRYENIFKAQRIVNGTHLLRKIRSVKTDYELSMLLESARLQTLSFSQIPQLYKAGMTDHEFSVEIERNTRLHGNLGLFRIFGQTMEAFMGTILAGDNAGEASPYDFALGGAGMHPSLPLGHRKTLIATGSTVMVDFNGNYTGYVTDTTRTFSVGKLPQKAYDVHQISIEIQARLAEMGKPGAVCEDLYLESLNIANKYGLKDCFMGSKQQAKFVGHGVGLVINELPVLCNKNKDLLEENMVIALEPKFILEGIGAVGTENTFIVRKNRMEKITTATEEIIDLLS